MKLVGCPATATLAELEVRIRGMEFVKLDTYLSSGQAKVEESNIEEVSRRVEVGESDIEEAFRRVKVGESDTEEAFRR